VNSRERVIRALERKIPDRVPHFEFGINSSVINSILPGADLLEFIEKKNLDAVAVRPNFKREEIEKNIYKDEKGLILRKSSEDYFEPVNTVIKNEKDLKKFEFPDPYDTGRFKDLKKAITRFKGKKAIVVFLRDGWSEVRELHGFSESLIDLYDNPSLIKGIIRKAVDYYTELGKIAAKLGADIAFSGDDIASTIGLLISPKHLKDIIFPEIKRLYKNWHSFGLYVIKHSDGNLNQVMDLLIETDLDCLHPIDPIAGMSLKDIKSKYGTKICLMGNVNCAGNLVFGTKEDVINEVKQCIDVAAPGGGYICASSNGITKDTKPENYNAMINTIKEYGKYN